jgi:(1->4)-alpha-D-glucan 1-alpha-D-glucosylmutase
MTARARRPITATYRLQLHAGFGFREAAALVDYLDALGVTHAYASPYLAARPGSTHGYDLVDPTRISPELGGEEAHEAWTSALAARGMGHVVDVVPNHMAATADNPWWADLLENGEAAQRGDYFDVEWRPPKEALRDKVLLPILGAQYGEVLEKGELRLERQGGAFFVRYYDRALPVSPPSVAPLLARVASALDAPPEDPRRQELESIVTGLEHLPASTVAEPDKRVERAREKEVLKRRLATLCDETPAIAAAVDAEVSRVNGAPGDPRSFDELDRLLLEQCYRLAFWRVATEEINYRRFFDINDLAAVRMEQSAVFDDAHALILREVAAGRVQGIRLDHTDGLYDPAAYFEKLRQKLDGVYLVAEKILSPGEELPASWPIDGTTGYDLLAKLSGLFVDKRAEAAFTHLYEERVGDRMTFAEHAHAAKLAIMRSSLSSEVHMLATRLERIAMRDRRSRDFTYGALRRAIVETIAVFPVYRTYVRPDGARDPRDEQIVSRAIRGARRRNPEMTPLVFDFLRDVLLLAREPLDEEDRAARVELSMRFQQLTGPVTAKGVEDTAFYTYVRFAALNEVGSSPERFGTSREELHAANAARRERWPRSMTATSTHDTKRGEDVRARLAVLTEMPDAWRSWVDEWLAIAEEHATSVDEEPAPSLADRYLFFQTAIGAFPLEGSSDAFVARLVEYAIKAAREAKRRTSWLSPDEGYEDALRAFVRGMMGDARFARSLAREAERIATHGASNGLAQVLLKIASPGVADTYQGSELWDLRLVDPDNRGAVDYEARRALLRRCEGASARELLAAFRDGRVKLHVLRAALRQRRAMPETFLEGDYAPIDAGEEIFAFSRGHASGTIVAAAARFPWRITRGEAPWAVGDVWGDHVVPIAAGRWEDALSGLSHAIGEAGLRASRLFAELPVALLVRR